MTPNFDFLEALPARSIALRSTTAMHHVHFTTLGFAAGAFPALATVTHATPETAPNAAAVARQTAAFLLRYLNEPGKRDE